MVLQKNRELGKDLLVDGGQDEGRRLADELGDALEIVVRVELILQGHRVGRRRHRRRRRRVMVGRRRRSDEDGRRVVGVAPTLDVDQVERHSQFAVGGVEGAQVDAGHHQQHRRHLVVRKQLVLSTSPSIPSNY